MCTILCIQITTVVYYLSRLSTTYRHPPSTVSQHPPSSPIKLARYLMLTSGAPIQAFNLLLRKISIRMRAKHGVEFSVSTSPTLWLFFIERGIIQEVQDMAKYKKPNLQLWAEVKIHPLSMNCARFAYVGSAAQSEQLHCLPFPPLRPAFPLQVRLVRLASAFFARRVVRCMEIVRHRAWCCVVWLAR